MSVSPAASSSPRRSIDSATVAPCWMTVAPSRAVLATLARGAVVGMSTVTGMPRRIAWCATPWAWLPAETATTPARRCAGVRARSRLAAPRSLKEPVNWRFSNFTTTSAPVIDDRVRDGAGGRVVDQALDASGGGGDVVEGHG